MDTQHSDLCMPSTTMQQMIKVVVIVAVCPIFLNPAVHSASEASESEPVSSSASDHRVTPNKQSDTSKLTSNCHRKEQSTSPPQWEPSFGLKDYELILDADLWSDRPEILSATVGFDGILGGIDTSSKESVIQAGGTWNENISCTNERDKEGAAVTSSAGNLKGIFDCIKQANHHDGMPVCFSWPVLPSSIQREHFKYTRSDGAVIYPNCLSPYPNFEFNERHCVVLVDDFFNRALPAETEEEETSERLFMKSLEIVGDLMLVGPGGQLHSAKGLSRFAPWDESAYVTGPRFLGARLRPADDIGEGATESLMLVAGANTMPNSVAMLYGGRSIGIRNDALYRLRLYTSGGMTPNGVTALKPDRFRDYFSIILSTGQTIDEQDEAVIVDGTRGGSIAVLGLADLGLATESYDDCYLEDRDNYIDIALSVRSGSWNDVSKVVSTVESVLAFHRGKYLYNPGGPGTDPAPGVLYTAPSPANQLVPVVVDVNGESSTSYCMNSSGDVSTSSLVCAFWRNNDMLLEIPFGGDR